MPHVYVLTSQKRGTLYIGVTSDLAKRIAEHRANIKAAFTSRHRVKRLVLIEEAPDMLSAIAREKQLKSWHRDWKINLIESRNPDWRDLALDLGFAPIRSAPPSS
jgi:putative endonuclease